MQITITGPRMSGSTTIAAFIARTLREKGMDVSFVANRKEHINRLERLSEKEEFNLSRPARVTIVEGVEQEDEFFIRQGV